MSSITIEKSASSSEDSFVFLGRKKALKLPNLTIGKCNYEMTNQKPDATYWITECLTGDFEYNSGSYSV